MTRLRPASPADIPFIMATEQRPGNVDVVGRWSAEEHASAMASPSHAYFIGEDETGQPVGFSMIQDRQEKSGNLLFRRIAVAQPGFGHGRQIFTQTRDWVFQNTHAHRLWLNVYRHNALAQRLYLSCGFVQDGVAREARLLSDGSRQDALILSILRREWEVLVP